MLHISSKSSQAAKCVKSGIITKVVNYILYIDTFEKKGVVLKGMLQSPCLKYHMKTIGIDQSLSNNPSVDQNFLNNIKNIYQHAGKCDDQQRLRDVPDAAMVTNPEEVTYVSPGFLTVVWVMHKLGLT